MGYGKIPVKKVFVKKQIKKYNYRRKDGRLIRVPTHKRTYKINQVITTSEWVAMEEERKKRIQKKMVNWFKEDDVYYYASEEEVDKYSDETILPFPIIVEMEEGQYLYYNTGDEQPTGVAPTLDVAKEFVSLHRDI